MFLFQCRIHRAIPKRCTTIQSLCLYTNVDALRRRPSEQRPCQREHPAYEHKFEQKKPASAVFVVLKCLVSALLVSLLALRVIRGYASLFLSSWISTINIGLA